MRPTRPLVLLALLATPQARAQAPLSVGALSARPGQALSGWLEDQSAVLTLLVRICDLGLNVVEMRRLSE